MSSDFLPHVSRILNCVFRCLLAQCRGPEDPELQLQLHAPARLAHAPSVQVCSLPVGLCLQFLHCWDFPDVLLL